MKPRQLKKLTHRDLDLARLILKRKQKELAPELKTRLENSLDAVHHDLRAKDWARLETSREQLCALIERDLAAYRPNQHWESFKALLLAVLIALGIRWLLVEPFRIPSGSMIPTLLVGDQLFVNKMVFGPTIPFTLHKLWLPRPPRRGEIVVFRHPDPPHTALIKRVAGLPGDKLEIRDGYLWINDQRMETAPAGEYHGPTGDTFCSTGPFLLLDEQLGSCRHPILRCPDDPRGLNFGPIIIEPGHFFAMGDNRDKSSDSRYWGLVPFANLKGKALFIHLPLDPDHYYLPRWERFFKWIDC
jgi:signal peptidase I